VTVLDELDSLDSGDGAGPAGRTGPQWQNTIIDTCNIDSHRTLKNKTPNQVYKDNDDQTARHLNDTAHNQAI
jgi:hypothetical protein